MLVWMLHSCKNNIEASRLIGLLYSSPDPTSIWGAVRDLHAELLYTSIRSEFCEIANKIVFCVQLQDSSNVGRSHLKAKSEKLFAHRMDFLSMNRSISYSFCNLQNVPKIDISSQQFFIWSKINYKVDYCWFYLSFKHLDKTLFQYHMIVQTI